MSAWEILIVLAVLAVALPLWRIAKSLESIADEIGRLRRHIGAGLFDEKMDIPHLRMIWRVLETRFRLLPREDQPDSDL